MVRTVISRIVYDQDTRITAIKCTLAEAIWFRTTDLKLGDVRLIVLYRAAKATPNLPANGM